MVEFRKWQKRYAQEKIAVRRIQRWWRDLQRRGKTGHVATQEKTSDGEGEGGKGGGEEWMREEGEEEILNLPQQDV